MTSWMCVNVHEIKSTLVQFFCNFFTSPQNNLAPFLLYSPQNKTLLERLLQTVKVAVAFLYTVKSVKIIINTPGIS